MQMEQWFEEIVETYGETDFTSQLLANMKDIIERSNTFVDFFSSLIHEWFQEYGLLLMDAGDPALRKIESRFLSKLLNEMKKLQRLF